MLSEDPNSNLERVYHLKLWLKERPGVHISWVPPIVT